MSKPVSCNLQFLIDHLQGKLDRYGIMEYRKDEIADMVDLALCAYEEKNHE